MSGGRSEFLRVNGLRYHLRCWGERDRPLLFVLHGWSDASATFELLVRPLLQRWLVVAPDWRGFGHSQWTGQTYWFPDYLADLDRIAEHYSPQAPLRLVAHSMGAQIASLYAGARPERVSDLVLLDGLFLPDAPLATAPRLMRDWLAARMWPPPPRRYESLPEFARIVLRLYPRLGAERAHWVAQRWSRPEADGSVSLLADPMHRIRGPLPYRLAHSEALWRCCRARTLFVDGAESPYVCAQTPEQRRQTLDCFPDPLHLQIEGAGHMLHLDAPEETAGRIAAFLAPA